LPGAKFSRNAGIALPGHPSEVAQKDVAVIKEIAALLETEAQAEADPRRSFLKTRAARLATRQVHPSNQTPRPAAVISAMGHFRTHAPHKIAKT